MLLLSDPGAHVKPRDGATVRLHPVAEVLRAWRPTSARLLSLLRSGITSLVVVALALSLAPGISVHGFAGLVRLAVTLALLATVLRPLLTALAALLGGLGVLLLALVLQAVLVGVAIALDPRVETSGFWATFGAAWFIAVFTACANWLADAGSDEAFLATALRQMRRDARRRTRHNRRASVGDAEHHVPTTPGMLILQIDGLSASVLTWSVLSGNLPTLGRWVRSGSHQPLHWHAGVPSTTPGSQAGLLHGHSSEVPAFRWYEKEAGRILVANRPKDAAVIERRLSDGQGLLADDGVSISNLFSGDAPTRLLTFSDASLPHGSTRGYAAFLTSPTGFARAVVLSVGEMFKELYQARRQRRLDIRPRVDRGGSYVLLRAATNVLLRDINLALIAGQMSRGANVIYCDFVDYDEVAHHAGPTRPEALRTLEGLDRVIGTLEKLVDHAPRPYEIVVLSDHGQSQGATFRQRYGETLQDLVTRLLAAERPAAATGRDEVWGPTTMLLDSTGGSATAPLGAAARAARRLDHRDQEPAPVGPSPDVVVVASGNLAMISLPDLPGRPRLEDLRRLHPGLVDGLVSHPGIGLVVVDSAAGPVVLGADGQRLLDTGEVTGTDPLARYGSGAAEALRRHARYQHVGDLVVISRVDPTTEEVAAFEELVGCHGGLGGAQTDALLLHPSSWTVEEPLDGSDAVHRQLVRWLESLGQRQGLPTRAPAQRGPEHATRATRA
jgi:uncharacterized membrane protein YvlD (DUF360 family)